MLNVFLQRLNHNSGRSKNSSKTLAGGGGGSAGNDDVSDADFSNNEN